MTGATRWVRVPMTPAVDRSRVQATRVVGGRRMPIPYARGAHTAWPFMAALTGVLVVGLLVVGMVLS